jgi:hypothetical protein
MADEACGYLIRQFETAWKLASFHLDGLALDHSVGGGALSGEDVTWPGNADGVREWVGGLQGRWRAVIERLSDDDLRSTEQTWWPFRDRPFGDVVAWVNLELTKNAAKIGYARFLCAVKTS